ncbi:DegT/DnrJ/EryC1/StrS family aminotransferase [Aliikangiella sp. IMCC44653]
MFRHLRPVGNPVKLTTASLDSFLPDFHLTGFGSGTQALAAALIAAKSQFPRVKDAKVLLPAYACPDLISACVFAKVKPILVDLEASKPWMDLSLLKSYCDPDVVAIIAVNFLGIPERIQAIRNATAAKSPIIIEDSAQYLPTQPNSSDYQGDLVILSFGRGKPLSMLEGGAVLTKSQALFDQLPQPNQPTPSSLSDLKYQLKATLFNIITHPVPFFALNLIPGINLGQTIYKPLTQLQSLPLPVASRLSSNFQRLAEQTCLVSLYQLALEKFNQSQLSDLSKLESRDKNGFLLRYPLLITNKKARDAILNAATKQRLGVTAMYQTSLGKVAGIPSELNINQQLQNQANHFAQQLLTLPVHSAVKPKDIKKIIAILNQYL